MVRDWAGRTIAALSSAILYVILAVATTVYALVTVALAIVLSGPFIVGLGLYVTALLLRGQSTPGLDAVAQSFKVIRKAQRPTTPSGAVARAFNRERAGDGY